MKNMFKTEYYCDACGKKMTDAIRCNALIKFGSKSVELGDLEICDDCKNELEHELAKIEIKARRSKTVIDFEKIKRLDSQSFTDAD